MNASSTRLATGVPVVTSPLSIVRPAQFSWPIHERLRADAEGPMLAEPSPAASSSMAPSTSFEKGQTEDRVAADLDAAVVDESRAFDERGINFRTTNGQRACPR